MNKKQSLFLGFLFCLFGFINAQTNHYNNQGYRLISSNIGNGGSSQILNTQKGTYKVSQSIGQSSVIGTSKRNGYYLRQGFQQPQQRVKIINANSNSLKADVYPNPFGEFVMIAFNENLSSTIHVELYNVQGRRVYVKTFSPSKQIELQIKDLSAGAYLLKAISNGRLLNSKLIKI